MHTLLTLWTLGAAALAAAMVLRLAGARRPAQLAVLALPLLGLAAIVAGLHHFVGRLCLIASPTWDYALGIALPLGVALVAAGAGVLGLVRFGLMAWVAGRSGPDAGPELRAVVEHLAARTGVAPPRLTLRRLDRPLALTWGVLRPRIVLSTWMAEHLDAQELEAVLAHELGHVARRDAWAVWAGTVLRDAFFYLPASWVALRRLRREQEPACDDLAVRATHRPLALASALAKVWDGTLAPAAPALGGAGLVGPSEAELERRIERLLKPRAAGTHRRAAERRGWPRCGSRALVVGTGALSLLALAAATAAGVLTILAAMNCGPMAPLGALALRA